MRNSALIVVLVCIIAGCGQTGKELVFDQAAGMSAEDQKVTTIGVEALVKSCPGISRYWADLKQIEPAGTREASLTVQRERGWKRVVSIDLRVSDKPELIPREYYAAGHSCRFEIGTAVSVAKSPCVSVCKDLRATEAYVYVELK